MVTQRPREELKFFSREFRIVGFYPGHPFWATFSEKDVQQEDGVISRHPGAREARTRNLERCLRFLNQHLDSGFEACGLAPESRPFGF